MARGTVKWFNSQKGFGFIQPQGGGKDVFVHISAVERAGLPGLNEGQVIEYEEVSNRGKTSAENLKVQRLRGEGSSPRKCGAGAKHSEPAGRPCPERVEITTAERLLRDRLPARLGYPEVHDLCLAQADGVAVCGRQAEANQALQHFKFEAARHYRGQREAAGRRGQHLQHCALSVGQVRHCTWVRLSRGG
jgi:cold shock protein